MNIRHMRSFAIAAALLVAGALFVYAGNTLNVTYSDWAKAGSQINNTKEALAPAGGLIFPDSSGVGAYCRNRTIYGVTDATVDTATIGTLTVTTFTGANAETIDNSTDDYWEFQGVGGTDNTDIRVDLDGTYPIWNSPTDSAIGWAEDTLYMGTNGEALVLSADDTFDFTREDSGTVTITASDDDANAALIVVAGGTGALTLGGASNTSVTVAADGTTDGDLVLPLTSVGAGEIVNDTIDGAQLADTITLDATLGITSTAGQGVDMTHAYADGVDDNAMSLVVTGLDAGSAATAQYGLYVENAASTEGADALLVLNNADADDVVAAAIVVRDAGGGYTNILDSHNINITGAGAIDSATGVSTSGVLDANGTVAVDTEATAGAVFTVTTQDVGGAGQTATPVKYTIADNSVEANGFAGFAITDARAGTENDAEAEAALLINATGTYGLNVNTGQSVFNTLAEFDANAQFDAQAIFGDDVDIDFNAAGEVFTLDTTDIGNTATTPITVTIANNSTEPTGQNVIYINDDRTGTEADNFAEATVSIDAVGSVALAVIDGDLYTANSTTLDLNSIVDVDTPATQGLVYSVSTQDLGGSAQNATPLQIVIADNTTEGDGFAGLFLNDDRTGTEADADNEAAFYLDADGTYGAFFVDGNVKYAEEADIVIEETGGADIVTLVAAGQTDSQTATIPDLGGAGQTFAMIGLAQTLTNKTIDASNNTISNLTAAMHAIATAQLYGVPIETLRQADFASMGIVGTVGDHYITGPSSFGAGAVSYLSGNDANNSSVNDDSLFMFTLPPEYVADDDVLIRVYAKRSGDAFGAETVDVQAYENQLDGTISADLVTTAAQNLTDSVAAYNFTLTDTGLAPGSVVQVLIRTSVDDSGGIGTFHAEIHAIYFVLDTQG